MKPALWPRQGISLVLYALLYGLATLALHQHALLGWLWGRIDITQRDGLAILATIEALQLALAMLSVLVLGLVSRWLMKAVVAVLLVTNAVAQNYMQTYGIVLDPTMIGNILNTNPGEVAGVFHPSVVLQGVLWGVLPALVALALPVRCTPRLVVAGAAVLVAAGFVTVVYAASGTWLWFDENGRHVGPRMLPWAYVGNGARYAAEYQRRSRVAHPLPEAQVPALSEGQREVVVLVIGEAARADHLGLYGYDRNTTPFTEGLGVVAFPGGRSCATYTIGAIACILSHLGNAAQVNDPWEALPSYLQRAGIATLVRENNAGLPPLTVGLMQSGTDLRHCDVACAGPVLDEVLLSGLAEELAAPNPARRFVVLHLNGSHGPEYFRKYPPGFATFQPVCETTLLDQCTPQSLVNAYDNSLRYTDWVLAQLIELLAGLQDTRSLMLYVSDHGQSLGENGIYLHGLPNALAPEEQRRVPLLLWMDATFARARGLDPAALRRPVDNPQEWIFHTVLGAFGAQSPVYRPELDLLLPPSSGGTTP